MAVILYPVATEKALSAIERENTLTIVVSRDATKPDVKKEVEAQYSEKVANVTTTITADGRKKARVKFLKKGAAADVAAKLKIL
jgi:large subunit ribosomal protein L23